MYLIKKIYNAYWEAVNREKWIKECEDMLRKNEERKRKSKRLLEQSQQAVKEYHIEQEKRNKERKIRDENRRREREKEQHRNVPIKIPDKLSKAYILLEVETNATEKQITKAYRKLIRVCHPDSPMVETTPETVARCKEINAAYTLIQDKVFGE